MKTKQTEFFRDMGRYGQILPSLIRMTCRARLDCSPREQLHEARRIAIDELEAGAIQYPDVAFIRDHITTLTNHDIPDIIEAIERPGRPGWGGYAGGMCPLQTARTPATGKTHCWTCPTVRRVLSHLTEDRRGADIIDDIIDADADGRT